MEKLVDGEFRLRDLRSHFRTSKVHWPGPGRS